MSPCPESLSGHSFTGAGSRTFLEAGMVSPTRRQSILAMTMLAVASGTVIGRALARADTGDRFPQRPLRLVDGFAPGGISDSIARMIAAVLAGRLGQPMVVENRPGAGGGVAAASVLQGRADGHSLLLAATSHAYSAALIPGVGFDLVRDFVPICGAAASPLVFVTRADGGLADFDDLVRRGRDGKGLTFGSGGAGTLTHLIPELLGRQLGLSLVHVGYRGTAPAIQDLIGGQVAFVADLVQTAAPRIASGRLRALAVTSPRRLAALPDVPTLGEVALPDFEAQGWYGVVAPAGTPPDALGLLRTSLLEVVGSPGFRERLEPYGASSLALDHAAFGDLIAAERQRWGDVVRALDIRLG